MTATELFQREGFRQLSLPDQLRVARAEAPDFAALSPRDQGTVLYQLNAPHYATREAMPEADRGFFGTLGTDLVSSVAAIPRAVMHPVQTAVDLFWDQPGALARKSLQAWREGSPSQAAGYGLAVPLLGIGPLAAEAGEELGAAAGRARAGEPVRAGPGAAHAVETLGLALAPELSRRAPVAASELIRRAPRPVQVLAETARDRELLKQGALTGGAAAATSASTVFSPLLWEQMKQLRKVAGESYQRAQQRVPKRAAPLSEKAAAEGRAAREASLEAGRRRVAETPRPEPVDLGRMAEGLRAQGVTAEQILAQGRDQLLRELALTPEQLDELVKRLRSEPVPAPRLPSGRKPGGIEAETRTAEPAPAPVTSTAPPAEPVPAPKTQRSTKPAAEPAPLRDVARQAVAEGLTPQQLAELGPEGAARRYGVAAEQFHELMENVGKAHSDVLRAAQAQAKDDLVAAHLAKRGITTEAQIHAMSDVDIEAATKAAYQEAGKKYKPGSQSRAPEVKRSALIQAMRRRAQTPASPPAPKTGLGGARD